MHLLAYTVVPLLMDTLAKGRLSNWDNFLAASTLNAFNPPPQ